MDEEFLNGCDNPLARLFCCRLGDGHSGLSPFTHFVVILWITQGVSQPLQHLLLSHMYSVAFILMPHGLQHSLTRDVWTLLPLYAFREAKNERAFDKRF